MRGVIKPILYFIGIILFAWLVAGLALALSSLGSGDNSPSSAISSTSVSSSVSSNQ